MNTKNSREEMKYSEDRQVVRELLMAADVSNTLSGGMSQPVVQFSKEVDHYLITARVPGVEVDRLNIEIVEKSLILYYSLEFLQEEKPMNMPHVVQTFEITADVDYERIEASQEGDQLKIVMPFNALADGYNRSVEIRK